jgi:hypothetical protein
MRLLAGGFAVTGILFLATPDGVVSALDDVGDLLGGFATGPETQQKLWLALAFAYMTVIAAIALVVSTDVARYRPLLLVLAAGKVASSLPAGAFFIFDEHVFVYLVTFVVDGALVAVSIACWVLSGRVEDRTGVLQ